MRAAGRALDIGRDGLAADQNRTVHFVKIALGIAVSPISSAARTGASPSMVPEPSLSIPKSKSADRHARSSRSVRLHIKRHRSTFILSRNAGSVSKQAESPGQRMSSITNNLVDVPGLRNQSGMVHKRSPRGQPFTAPTVLENFAWQTFNRQMRKNLASAAARSGDGGTARRRATVPSWARYRKEITGGSTMPIAHPWKERLNYLRELEERPRHSNSVSSNRAARCRAGSGHPRRRQQRAPGRPSILPFQAEAPHQGRDRQRRPVSSRCRNCC